MLGIGGIVGIVFFLSNIGHEILLLELVLTLIVAGLIAFSRLTLNAHTPKQVIAGFLIGSGILYDYEITWPEMG